MIAQKNKRAEDTLIAVVDDDEDVRAALDGLLRSLGYSTDLFDSADAFLASPRLDFADCIISDVQMPGTNGLQLARAARAHAKPVILITAYPTADVEKRAASAGARCVLVKPFDSRVLVDQLRRLLG